MGDVGSRGLTFFYEIVGEDGLLLAEGSTRHLFTDTASKPIRIPEKIRARFAEFVGA
jgi:acyl-CoA thioesterase FadM